MKKVLPALILASFFAVLAIPIAVLAANPLWQACPNSCEIAAVNCNCGENAVGAATPRYCWNGVRYGLDDDGKISCLSAAVKQPDASTAVSGEEPAPLIFSDVKGLKTGITNVMNWVFSVLIVVASLMLIIAGFIFITAAGDSGRLTQAREMLIYALVGLAVAVAARGLVALMQNLLGA